MALFMAATRPPCCFTIPNACGSVTLTSYISGCYGTFLHTGRPGSFIGEGLLDWKTCL